MGPRLANTRRFGVWFSSDKIPKACTASMSPWSNLYVRVETPACARSEVFIQAVPCHCVGQLNAVVNASQLPVICSRTESEKLSPCHWKILDGSWTANFSTWVLLARMIYCKTHPSSSPERKGCLSPLSMMLMASHPTFPSTIFDHSVPP
jgi:hypothetical protein